MYAGSALIVSDMRLQIPTLPIDSATISAQKPGGSVRPALSGAHTGLLPCAASGWTAIKAAIAKTTERSIECILLDVGCGNIQLSGSTSACCLEANRAVTQRPDDRCAGCNIAVSAVSRVQTGSRARRREPRAVHAADGGSDFQLRRARLPGNRDIAISDRSAPQERLHGP